MFPACGVDGRYIFLPSLNGLRLESAAKAVAEADKRNAATAPLEGTAKRLFIFIAPLRFDEAV